MITRRQLLIAGATMPFAHEAFAKPKNLRGGEILPDPAFVKPKDYLVGVRPYRKTGVRLERVDAPLKGANGDIHLVHNYGHGGAGVTLSWGCASVVVDHVDAIRQKLNAEAPPAIAVLGTGIIGLTTATELRRRWPKVPITIYAKSLDLKTTVSWVAGGQFEPSGMHRLYKGRERREELHDLVRRSAKRVVELQNSGKRHDYGVAVRKNYALDRKLAAFEVGMPRDVVAKPRRGNLPFANLNIPGREYQTWLMTPMILMPKLVEDLKASGVKFVERSFSTPADVAKLSESVVVNCTGLGSRDLFSDGAIIPQRGHNVLLEKTDPKQFYFFSGGCKNWVIAYVFCRQNDVVVGGTIQKGRDDVKITPEDKKVFAQLLTNGRALFDGKVSACVRP